MRDRERFGNKEIEKVMGGDEIGKKVNKERKEETKIIINEEREKHLILIGVKEKREKRRDNK